MRSMRPELHRSQKILIAALVFWHAPMAFASDDGARCTEALLRTSTSVTRTPLTSSLAPAEQHESADKTIRDLAGLRLHLDLAKVSGSRALELTALEAEFGRKEQDLIAYLEKHQIMTRDGLRERMKREIARHQDKRHAEHRENDRTREDEERRRREQDERIKDSFIDGTHAIFHRIEPGSFQMGEVGKQVDVTLTQPFEMLTTPTTQIIWKTVAEIANARFGGKYAINPDPSKFKGDTHPVEMVSYDDVQIWLNALNELSQAGEPSLADLIRGHKAGDIYRLPTDAEWEFVIRGRGQYNDMYHFGSDASQLGDYAWFSDNSNRQTQPVARKKPLMIGIKEFYDMHGNVDEWVHDWYKHKLRGGTDPQGPSSKKSDTRVIRVGSWHSSAGNLRSTCRGNIVPERRCSNVGFRFVRATK